MDSSASSPVELHAATTAKTTGLPSYTNDYRGYDHATWYVGNGKQVASWYVARMGFEVVAYQGLETGSRCVASYVISNGRVRFVLTSAICNSRAIEDTASAAECQLVLDIHEHLEKHGDAVKDVAFEVDDVPALYSSAITAGAVSVKAPTTTEDSHGLVVTASIKTFGDTTHTFVDRRNYRGEFLPGFRSVTKRDPIQHYLPQIHLDVIDHCVGNQDWGDLESTCNFYKECLGFRRFWTVDDRTLTTAYTTMNSVVMASPGQGKVKIPINEPAVGKKKSQIEEFVQFFGGAGIQHLAFKTNHIVSTVTDLKHRGVEFISVPSNTIMGFVFDLEIAVWKSTRT